MSENTELSTGERAFAVAAVRALGLRAENVCARRSAALKRYAQLLAKESALLDAEASSLDAPIPAGLSEVHPSWFDAPPPAAKPTDVEGGSAGDAAADNREIEGGRPTASHGRAVDSREIEGGRPTASHGRAVDNREIEGGQATAPMGRASRSVSSQAARAWIERRAYGHLVEMRSDKAAAGVLDKLPRRDSGTLEGLLLSLGRRRVAIAFSGAPRAALARLCARLGEPAASELLVEVRGLRAQLSPDEVREAQRALFGFGGDGDPAGLFERAGCGLLGPALRARGGDLLRRVAQRLPRALGEALTAAAQLTGEPHGDTAAIAAQAVALLLPRSA